MDNPIPAEQQSHQQQSADLLLDIAVLLMSSGAHTERVNRNLNRLAAALGFKVELFFSLSGITITLTDQQAHPITAFKKIPAYGVQLSVVSAISRLSWKALESKMSFQEIEKEVLRIGNLPHYPKPFVVIMLALAGMAFCRVAGGEMIPVLLAGFATAIGFLTRNALMQKKYALPVCISAASFVASGISGLGMVANIGAQPEIAVATSVLFLVPGVPMINGVIDLMHGHMITGQGRAMQGIVFSFAIAIGITLSSTLLGVLMP